MHTTLRVLVGAAVFSAFVPGLQPQGLMRRPNVPPDYLDNRAVDVARIAREQCTVEIDNYRMRVIRFRVPANSRVPIHSHRPGVIVAVTPLQLRLAPQYGSEIQVNLPAGDIRWIDSTVHSEENTANSPAEYLFVEAKN